MTPDRWRQITAAFHAVLGQPPERRELYLRATHEEDAPLRREVESLIAAHHDAGSFGDTPVSLPCPHLDAGTPLGPYRIECLIGAGGMGEVYRAHDPRLGRAVAIKVLPSHFASSHERLARFEREAQVLASLNHPNIGAIYGVEDAPGGRALVMELVEGEDLADRLTRGPMPLREALEIARQIAEALEAAHDQGIIHRDLKPANIMVRGDGAAKVLDFGLAKALETAAHTSTASASTIGSVPLPAPTLLGTAGYMSPEHALGKPIDKRSDIWSFGVLLFEMLTGRPLYMADTAAETLARVVEQDPDVGALPPTLPPDVRALIARCLTKDPRNRLQAMGEARIAIDRELSLSGTRSPKEPPAGTRWTRRPGWQLAATGLALAVAGVSLAAWLPWRTLPAPTALRLTADLGPDLSLAVGRDDALALSPDGRVLAFVAHDSEMKAARLYLRAFSDLTLAAPTPIPGTEGAESPFFSPDGQQIAFFAGGRLKRVPVAGGTPVTLCDAPKGRGGSWSEDGTIVFVPNSGPGVTLWRVSSAGGEARPLATLAQNEWGQRWPQVLPGGRAVLYTAPDRPGGGDNANLVVRPMAGGAPKVVRRGGYHGRYVGSGHLVYLQAGTLFAMPFDLDRLEQTGPAASVVGGVSSNSHMGSAQFDVAAGGTLVYRSGPTREDGAKIEWIDRAGSAMPLRNTPENWFNIRIAPDGRRLAVDLFSGPTSDIWVHDMERDTATPLTRHPAQDMKAVWTPDGQRIAFNSNRHGSPLNLYWQRADGTGEPQRLTESRSQQWPISWHPSGRFLAFEESNPETSWDLMVLPIYGDESAGWRSGKQTVFLAGPAAERQPTFSPDGRWLAYQSDETGRNEVYVRPFASTGEGWRVSTEGGTFPTWSHTSRELFYGLRGQLMVVRYAIDGEAFRAEKPRLLPNVGYDDHHPARMFDLHPDGKRFAVAPAAHEEETAPMNSVTVILNFAEELRRIAPVSRR